MHLYLLRHGEADWPDWEGKDDDRPLTKSGLPRASQTADIAAEHLKVRVHEESMLAPGFRAATLATIRRKYPQQVLMLVGHEPDFSEVVAAFTGGKVKFAKAGVALVELTGRKGKLLWLFPPKLAK